MPGKAFVDSNVWIYAKFATQDLRKHRLARQLLSESQDDLVISTQVVAEVANVMFRLQQSAATVREEIERLMADIAPVLITADTLRRALEIKQRYQLSLFDSQIVASAIENGCDVLWPEDLSHAQQFEGSLEVVNPFREL